MSGDMQASRVKCVLPDIHKSGIAVGAEKEGGGGGRGVKMASLLDRAPKVIEKRLAVQILNHEHMGSQILNREHMGSV
jgi:hypothetical protein